MQLLIVLSLCVLAAIIAPIHAKRDFSELNQKIDWVSGEDFKALDLSSNTKPIAVLLTQPWCGACKRLKSSMTENGQRLVDASKQYIMVTVDGKENDNFGELYAPDGQYIPRIILAEPSGKVRPDLVTPDANPKYKYFPGSADTVAAMLEEHAPALIKDVKEEL